MLRVALQASELQAYVLQQWHGRIINRGITNLPMNVCITQNVCLKQTDIKHMFSHSVANKFWVLG